MAVMGSFLMSQRAVVATLGSGQDIGAAQAFALDDGLLLPYNEGEASIERFRGGGLQCGAGKGGGMPCGNDHGCSMDGWC
jgi:hypothetical protein